MVKKLTDFIETVFGLNHFEYPFLFFLFLLIPLLYFINRLYKKKGFKFIFYSSSKLFKKKEPSLKIIFAQSIFGFKLLALFFIIIALARPQKINSFKVEKVTGVNIMITLDISGSMKALDFHPANRLETAKVVINDFIKKRVNDKIGLIVFAGTAYTKSPLTINYDFLNRYVLETSTEDLKDEGGTAIGVALATAVNRLVGIRSVNSGKKLIPGQKIKKKSARGIIILLTDGVNNTGEIDPNDAADMAKDFNIKVYTIGIGKSGRVPYIDIDPFGNKRQVMVDSIIDEDLLKKIAKITGGLYFNATKKETLIKIFEDINKWEKTEISSRTIKDVKERYFFFLLFGFFLFFLAEILKRSILRVLP